MMLMLYRITVEPIIMVNHVYFCFCFVQDSCGSEGLGPLQQQAAAAPATAAAAGIQVQAAQLSCALCWVLSGSEGCCREPDRLSAAQHLALLQQLGHNCRPRS
jgi:hypothetical protein